MPLHIEPQGNFQGFGNGNRPGELFFASGMFPTLSGFAPYWNNQSETDSVSISGMSTIQCFAEDSSGNLYGVDANGLVVKRTGTTWAQARPAPSGSAGNGILIDQKGRLLVARNQWLQKYDGSWTDSWQNFGSVVASPKGMDVYLDWVVIPHGNVLCLLNTIDDSFNSAAFTLPSGCTALSSKSNKTGILTAVNMSNRSFVFLWDANSQRALHEWIWFKHPIRSICAYGDSWIVTTTREVWLTNGLTSKQLPDIADVISGTVLYSPSMAGTTVIENRLFMAHNETGGNYGRRMSGIRVLDLNTHLWQYIPTADFASANVSLGGLFESSTGQIITSHTNNVNSLSIISQISNSIPTRAHFVAGPFGKVPGTRKIGKGAKVDFLANLIDQSVGNMSFTLSLKVYDYTRPLFSLAVENGTSPDKSTIAVDGSSSTTNKAQVGDEVTFLSGANAGQIRHITNITNQGLSNETWTLDSALANLIESGAFISVQPFKKVNSFSVANLRNIPVNGFYFDIMQSPKARRFLVKVVFEGITGAALAVYSTSLMYEDMGII